jgi:hypothetical protein
MSDLDQELVERVTRWCAEAGRTTSSAEIDRALGSLSWDELLAVRALLADPPPARPLGPFALADLARGVSAEMAAEREREGRYPTLDVDAGAAPPPPSAPAPAPAPRAKKAGGKRAPRGPGVVIRRARDATPPVAPPAPTIPLVEELFLPEGRAVLERLVRHLGARRHALVAALAEGWRSVDGRPADDDVLTRLLDQHGLARAFARREHDELLHALRASGGLRSAAAARLGLDRDALDAALARAGATAEAEGIREARRAEVRAKATLAERVKLLLVEPARLEDLGILAEVEDDLRTRLPEHIRAVGAAGGPLLVSLARSLSASPVEVKALVDRLGVAIEGGPSSSASSPRSPPPRARPRAAFGAPPGAKGGMRTPRRPAVDRAGRAGPARSERRGPAGGSGTFGSPAGGRRTGGFGGPGERRDRGGSGGRREPPPQPRFAGPSRSGDKGAFGAPARRRESGFGPPAKRRESPPEARLGGPSRSGDKAGFARPGERRDRGFAGPGERRDRGGSGGRREASPQPRFAGRTGGKAFGGPGARRSGPPPAGGSGGRPGRPGPRPGTRPGGPRGKPPRPPRGR